MDTELIHRRLLLSKEFYLYANERSYKADSVNKMMAVHNFHIAVEIVLRAIILQSGIRSEKTLNIDFETMLADIDKSSNRKLPHRQELRSLNQVRNLIQHHGLVPEDGSVVDFRVISRLFLEKVFLDYFGVDFSRFSRISLVQDGILRRILLVAQRCALVGRATDAIIYGKLAFELASSSAFESIPNDVGSTSHAMFGLRDFREVERAIAKTHERISGAERLAMIVASGTSLADLKRLRSFGVAVDFSVNGTPIVHMGREVSHRTEDGVWMVDFVTACVNNWQQQDLAPLVAKWAMEAISIFLSDEELKVGGM